MSSNFIGFHNINNIGDKPLVSQLEDNLKSFLDYSFLKIGGFINVNIPTSGLYGGDFATLKPSQDPGRTSNTVWETSRKDWVYESGICHNNRCPIPISGISINNIFSPGPTGSPPNAYIINYPMGQVIFNNPQPAAANIKLNYSYRYIQVYKANESSWWKELQKLSYDPATSVKNKGQIITANHRVQLPAIIIETIARTSQTPYELGNTKNIVSQDMLLHIYSENPIQRNTITDMLLLQKDRETFLYDINSVLKDSAYKLQNNGQINPSGLNYDQIITDSRYQKNIFYIENSTISELNTLSESLYNGVVRWTLKIYP
jgi:hypothetical protein